MVTRILPPTEWSRLAGTEAEALWPNLDSRTSQVLVVEDEHGEIIGTWTLISVLHAECLWIAPAHRGKGRVALRLLQGLNEQMDVCHTETVATSAVSDDVRSLLAKLGAFKLEGDHYVLRKACLPQ